ncbi:hypothetical protein H6G13_00295 [Pseudanabaena sp. FACHB-2040]|nr:hypothetical protein [Pseudanabaena sp. FACHB-2040]
MSAPVVIPQKHLEQLISQICMTRKITRQDQHLLMRLGSQAGLNEQQTNSLNFLYERLHSGCIRVVD